MATTTTSNNNRARQQDSHIFSDYDVVVAVFCLLHVDSRAQSISSFYTMCFSLPLANLVLPLFCAFIRSLLAIFFISTAVRALVCFFVRAYLLCVYFLCIHVIIVS